MRTVHGYVEVSFRSIKQDPLCKRPVIVYGEAWRAIGGCTGLLNVDWWLSLYDGLMFFFTPYDACNTPFLLMLTVESLSTRGQIPCCAAF